MERPIFNPNFYRELASENPFGLELHWREVEAWFNHIAWPAYKTYNYRQHRKTVRRWWAHCSFLDLERARDAMDNVKMERMVEQQDVPGRVTAQEVIDNPPNNNIIRKVLGGRGGRGD